MAFDVLVQLALGADLTASPTSWAWTDITTYVHMGDGNRVTISRGRGDEFSTAPPCRIGLTLINNDGRFCPHNPTGAYFGQLARNTPLRVRVHNGSSYVTQALGFVDQWPATWADKSESLCLAPITASGGLRRLGQGGTVRSALYRYHASNSYVDDSEILGYWPCEDASGSTSIASGIGGRAGILSGGLENFAADSSIAGSDPLMTLEPGVSFVCYLPTYTSTGETAIRAVVKVPAAPGGTVELLRWWSSGSYTVWTVEIHNGSPDRLHLRAYNSLGVEQLGGTGINLEDDGHGVALYGRQLYIAVDLVQDGADIDWQIQAGHTWAFDAGESSANNGTEAAATVGQLEAIGSHNHSAPAEGITLGHIAVATTTAYTFAASPAVTGFAGQSVTIRLADIATELDISVTSSGPENAAMYTYLGATDATDIITLLREVETAEQGILYDGKTGFLELLLREDRINRAVDLTLNHDTGQVDWLAPTVDDQQIVNDVTVSRPGGSSARAFDKDHIAANGNYATTVQALLFTDDVLPYHAQWRRHLGTVDELRYPTVGLNLAANPSLLADWLACDIGSRIQVTNPPDGLPPDTIDLHIEGYTEQISTFGYTVQLNCSPASPWQVFEVEDASLGRVGMSTSELLCAYDSDDTALLVASRGIRQPDGTYRTQADARVPLWSTIDESYDVAIAGERLTVTSMAAPAPSFVGAGTATHGDNATLTPNIHASAAKGDLILVLAAIRDTAATVDTPTDYTVLADLDNVCLFGKIHDGAESSPSITFTGGGAGDTTSAQTATFRGFQLEALSVVSQTNASAQNIAFGAFAPTRANLLVLWFGQKADDWTSAGGLFAGVTEIAEASTTTGDDQALVWNHIIQTSPVEYVSGSWTITGGASAVSKSCVLALPGDVQTATVTRSVNGVVKSQTAGTAVSLWKPGVAAL